MDKNILARRLDLFLRLCVYAVLFLVPLIFWLPANESFETPKTVCFFSLLALAYACLAVKWALKGSLSVKWTALSIPAAALVVLWFASMLKGLYINRAAFAMHWQFFKFITANVLFYFLIINTFGRRDIPKLLFFILSSHFIVVTYGIFQYLGMDFIKWVSFGEGRVYSTMGNPDYMAAQFSVLIPVMIALILSPVKKIYKFTVTFFLCLMFVLIIVSHGRGAWLGFIGSLLFMFAVSAMLYGGQFFARNKVFVAGIAAFVVLLVVIFSFPNPLNKNSQSILERLKGGFNLTSDSVAVRLFYWESALQMAAANPVLGTGPGGFSLNTAYYQRRVYDRWLKAAPDMAKKVEPHVELYTHNDFLQTAAENGFAGLGVYLWLFASILIMSIYKAFREQDEFMKNLSVGIAASAAAFLINGLLNFPWRVASTVMLMWSILALFSLTEQKKSVNMRFGLPGITACAGFAAALLFSAFQFNALLANSSIRAGQAAFMAKDYNTANSVFERAIRSNARGTDMIELVLYNGNAYNAKGDIKNAIEYYNRGLRMFPHFIESHYNVGNVYMNNGMTDMAVAEYNKVLDLNPKFTAAINNLANIYFNKGDFAMARDMYIRALSVKPEGVEARYNLGATYFRMKDYKNAYVELSKCLEYDPNYAMAKEWIERMKAAGLVR
ncbi:MAG: tetratricopeptide repeat protein [Spirochaetia bacterium]|nr:tetratricopeptide repeat protein [Spirochaetia bacterium]